MFVKIIQHDQRDFTSLEMMTTRPLTSDDSSRKSRSLSPVFLNQLGNFLINDTVDLIGNLRHDERSRSVRSSISTTTFARNFKRLTVLIAS